MKKAKVSIIIPAYNASKYLNRCLDSILNQSFKDLEVLVILNGCTDNSLEILTSYNKKIKVFELPKPSISEARNLGIKKALGDYILFFDADDFMEEEMVLKLYEKALKSKADLVYSDYYTFYEQYGKKEVTINGDDDLNNLYKVSLGPIKLFKKDIIIKNNILFPLNLKYEDMPFVLTYLVFTKKISKVNIPLFNYVIHDNSEQTVLDERVFDLFKILDIINKLKLSKKGLENINVKTLITFALKQKYQKDHILGMEFIDKVFSYLNTNYPTWKECKYLKEESLLKKMIKQNKLLIKIYCSLYFLN